MSANDYVKCIFDWWHRGKTRQSAKAAQKAQGTTPANPARIPRIAKKNYLAYVAKVLCCHVGVSIIISTPMYANYVVPMNNNHHFGEASAQKNSKKTRL